MFSQGFEIWLELMADVLPELVARTYFASDDEFSLYDEYNNMTRYDVLQKDSDQFKSFH